MVLNPKLPEHLSHFGIDMMTMEKVTSLTMMDHVSPKMVKKRARVRECVRTETQKCSPGEGPLDLSVWLLLKSSYWFCCCTWVLTSAAVRAKPGEAKKCVSHKSNFREDLSGRPLCFCVLILWAVKILECASILLGFPGCMLLSMQRCPCCVLPGTLLLSPHICLFTAPPSYHPTMFMPFLWFSITIHRMPCLSKPYTLCSREK